MRFLFLSYLSNKFIYDYSFFQMIFLLFIIKLLSNIICNVLYYLNDLKSLFFN